MVYFRGDNFIFADGCKYCSNGGSLPAEYVAEPIVCNTDRMFCIHAASGWLDDTFKRKKRKTALCPKRRWYIHLYQHGCGRKYDGILCGHFEPHGIGD